MTDVVTPEERSRIMAAVRSRDTAPEKSVRSLLHRMGYRFRLHRRDLPGCPDIVLPRFRLVIFVHGCFWHRHPGCGLARIPKTRVRFWTDKLEGNRARDLRNQAGLRDLGWSVLVVWECELRDMELLDDRIRDTLKARESEIG